VGGPELNLDKITPEFAAKIVKHFVLPMFDNSASSRVGRRLGQKQTLVQSGSIYNELKLSDQLNETLTLVRNEVMRLTGSLEEERENRRIFEHKHKALTLKFLQQ